MSFVAELWEFLRSRKKFWLMPIVIMMVIFGGLVFLTKGSAVARRARVDQILCSPGTSRPPGQRRALAPPCPPPAFTGKPGSCFLRVKRSSCAALTTTPSRTIAAALS